MLPLPSQKCNGKEYHTTKHKVKLLTRCTHFLCSFLSLNIQNLRVVLFIDEFPFLH